MNAHAMPFPEAAERVKSALDIIDIVQRHVILRKSGRNYTGKCPFHNDKNPSMSVSQEKNLFKCFSCGAGGDALGFLMRIENKTYGEAIRDLAHEQGITIIHDGQNPQQAAQQAAKIKDEKQSILTLNARTQQWFHNQLLSTEEAASVRDYLSNRGIDESAIYHFGFGYAPQGWENLSQFLKNNEPLVKEDPDLLVTAGLSTQKQEGAGYFDRFRHRLMVPIHDERGQVVAFGGRALSPDEKAKYLNSPETAVYHKSRILYGLHFAKETIRQTKSAVVMEGYFDVISAHLAGITQTVGSCGTALTEQQVKLLTRFGAETLYLGFDADDAGQKAALSAIQLIEPYLSHTPGLSVKILALPEDSPYKDPDEFIRNAGKEAFLALFPLAKPFLEFKFDYALRGINVKSAQGRVDAAQKLTPYLSAITQPVLRMEMLSRYAERIGVSEEALMQEVRQHGQQYSQSSKRHFQQFTPASAQKKHWGNKKNQKPVLTDNLSDMRRTLQPSHINAERGLLCLVLAHQDAPKQLLPQMLARTFQHPVHHCLFNFMLKALDEFELDELTLEDLLSFVRNSLHQQVENPITSNIDAHSALAELLLTAETYTQGLKLSDATPAETWRVTLLREVTVLCERIDRFRQKDALKQLVSRQEQAMPEWEPAAMPAEGADAEMAEIERQYQLYEELKARRNKFSPNQAISDHAGR